jgi:hypothetical protein
MVAALTADGSPKVVVAGAVAPGLAVAVAVGVALAAGDAVALAVELVVALADAVPVGVAVAVGLASLAETSEVDAFAEALAVELTDGVALAVPLAVPVGVADGLTVGLTLVGAVDAPVYASLSSTGRKASLAVVSIKLTTLVAALPGTVTVIWSLPWV